MSVVLPPPGSTSRVLRHLRHMLPPQGSSVKGNGKFSRRGVPRYGGNGMPAYVQPKDRIAYWNIAPGDEVVVTRGSFVGKDGQRKQYGGIVASVDQERNLVWLRAAEEDKPELTERIPTQYKHMLPRLYDPEDPSKGYSSNVSLVPKPVHYSNLSLKLPTNLQLPENVKLDLKKGVYASRLTRSGVKYDRKKGAFVWERYAIVPTLDQGTVKVHVPWKKSEGRQSVRRSNASVAHVVDRETWVPWSPTDPIFVSAFQGKGLGSLSRGFRTSPASEERLVKAMEEWRMLHGSKKAQQRRRGLLLVGDMVRQSVKAPPVAQAPTPSEQVAMLNESRAGWSRTIDDSDASASFAESDYLDLAPAEGPLSSAVSRTLPLVAAHSSSSGAIPTKRDGKTGRLGPEHTADKRTVDAWPIELLMKDDLTNEGGLKTRMRRWREKQLEKKQLDELAKFEEHQNIQALRDLKL
ncbi:hypothetical protein FA10DRAFT_268100 [Acaromyces ingoldii]|uniref:KOW domain-containing protein n=1 Tax=Acaromyces ingoldii TaxID=215250 RepID=A0A316YK28_9BASI|nr:hypothetical protein FA10DRAFT_268100 [Acaromyces ingoldii]PWN89569.1 hypothetical protein FA10DRAFT_268100 [Acaromyces ingoldii]